MFGMQNKTPIRSGLLILVTLLVAGSAAAQMTSADLVPTGRILIPGLSTSGFKAMPPTFTAGAIGTDPDAADGRPSKYRFLVKPAVTDAGSLIITPADYNLHYQEILSLDDPMWTSWQAVPADPAQMELHVTNLTSGQYYLVSVQFMDQDGAVSDPWGYQTGTAHIKALAGVFAPQVVLAEYFMGQTSNAAITTEIAGDQPLNFSWAANADLYGGQITSYRHGWDLLSVDDPNDPGWAVPPGLDPQNLFAEERHFSDGFHTFTVRVEDDAQQVTVVVWTLRVVPYVAPAFQLPLLVLDQTIDYNVQNWPDQSGQPRNDESFRNSWWHFLADGVGGVAGLNWDRDWYDHRDQVSFSDLVNYQAVLCYAQANDAQRLFREFRPVDNQDQYVWLTPYQHSGGNFFLVGGGSMESFLEAKSNYMVPMIFDTTEESLVLNGQIYEVGFGTTALPDGTVVQRGPRMYPYATAGIAALDWTSPNTKFIYNRSVAARFDRNVDCVGLKGLVLAPEFKVNHLIGSGVVADTMWTDPVIDWHDPVDAAADTLRLFHNTFRFRNDEFVDANISSRTTPINPQDCLAGPGGRCVEPMFQGISRFDYIREYYWAKGESNWPESRYIPAELDDGCGPLALTSYGGMPRHSARTNDQTYGYFSYKSVADKPSGKADVYWGFDPYRFDHTEASKAVRWVLQYFGLQINQ